MKELYLVEEYGGDYEDRWKSYIAVFTSEELANQLADIIKEKHTASIDRRKWDEMIDNVLAYEYDNDMELGEITEAIHTLYPTFDLEDIEKARYVYDLEQDWDGVEVKKINLVENNSDINELCKLM